MPDARAGPSFAHPGVMPGHACALPGDRLEGRQRFQFRLVLTGCGPLADAAGGYSFTDAVALMITWEAVGGFFIVHLPPDLARMARSLNW
jgi:hypothetical protein